MPYYFTLVTAPLKRQSREGGITRIGGGGGGV